MVSPAALSAFFEESEGHIETSETSLINLEKKRDDVEAINELFRAVHSLKGNAGIIGFHEIHSVATEMETILDDLRKRSKQATQEELDKLFLLLDSLRTHMEVASAQKDATVSAKKEHAPAQRESAEPAQARSEHVTHRPSEQEVPGSAATGANPGEQVEKETATSVVVAQPDHAESEKQGMVIEQDEGSSGQDKVSSYLTFTLGKETYGIEIEAVREIILSKDLTRMPKAKDYIKGIMNLRGMVIPVIDAKKRFGFKETKTETAQSEHKNIIIVEEDGLRTGIYVDFVDDIKKFEKDQIVSSSEIMSGARSDYVSGVGKAEDANVVIINTKVFCGIGDKFY